MALVIVSLGIVRPIPTSCSFEIVRLMTHPEKGGLDLQIRRTFVSPAYLYAFSGTTGLW
jgi:hypothetical protein